MKDKLKPCPFCGGQFLKITLTERKDRPNPWKYTADVLCLNCFGQIGNHGFDKSEYEAKENAVKAWNRRAGEETNNA